MSPWQYSQPTDPLDLNAETVRPLTKISEIQCPQELRLPPGVESLFVAGGIGIGGGEVANWQQELIYKHLHNLALIALNPRREHFPAGDSGILKAQVEWEHSGLHSAQAISFWLPAGYSCPITLYELGLWSARAKPIFVGIDKEYPHADTLAEQLNIHRPDLMVVDNLPDLAEQIKGWHSGSGRIDLPAPRPSSEPKSIYLTGGIAECPNWQSGTQVALNDCGVKVKNPRDDQIQASELTREALRSLARENHQSLLSSEAFCVWFPKESRSPTSLFELGALASMTERPLFVGADPEYFRYEDVLIQTGLARPEVQVTDNLPALHDQIRSYYQMR